MIDLAEIKVQAGNGGDGIVSFSHEKFKPKNGPDGGDGGKGGSVYFIADHNMATLIDFHSKPLFKAHIGMHGLGRNMKGPDGDDIEIKVPLGTLIFEKKADGIELVADMNEKGKKILIAKGGNGGVGNFRFRSSTNQTPRQYIKGEPGDVKDLKLEIKMIADVGLVGSPNAGKSTLINRLTNSHAKVANYPFTTINPNLGVLRLKDQKEIIFCDIPGLIEGASEGKGLGDEFLRHVERTKILVHLIDAYPQNEGENPVDVAFNNYKMLEAELKNYKVDLTKKERVVVVNKIDITEIKENLPEIIKRFKKEKIDVIGISGVTGENLDLLVEKILSKLQKIPDVVFEANNKVVKTYTIENLPNKRLVYGKSKVLELEY